MRILSASIFFIAFRVFSQDVDSLSLHSFENIIRFANHLFCDRDYLRATNEFLRIDESQRSDILNLKLGISLLSIGEKNLAKNVFNKIDKGSFYFEYSQLEMLKSLFQQNEYAELRQLVESIDKKNSVLYSSGQKLLAITLLKDDTEPISYKNFAVLFSEAEKKELEFYYHMKINPGYKNPMTASILSMLIPGSGKIYTNEISDGIYAFLVTGLFTFLAYDNFKAKHNFRAWLFTGLAAGFYAGNVYGSYASAQIHNAKVKYELNLQLDTFLKIKNYFMPDVNLCE